MVKGASPKDIYISTVGANITIDANGDSRVFNIAAGTTVGLAGLTITGGAVSGNGGGILNAGELYLFECVITGNEARRGGGLANTGTVTMFDTDVLENRSSSYGGGIYNQRGTVRVTGGEISGNEMIATQLQGGAVSGGTGGGVYNAATLFMTDTKILNNSALLFAGGGLSNEGKATLEGCTIAGNEAEWGGGVSNSNYGTMTITDSFIEDNTANKGYGGIGNAGDLTLTDTIVKNNKAGKYGGGLGNNTGKAVLNGSTDIINNTPDNIWSKPEEAVIYHNTLVAPAGLSFAPVAPTYEISTPDTGELFAKTLTYWEFSATAISSSPIKDWEIDWGDSSEPTQILGGPRSRVSVTHYFREAGTYSVTIKTTDFDGVVNTITIGTYTVKEKVLAIEPVAAESFAWIEPLTVESFAWVERMVWLTILIVRRAPVSGPCKVRLKLL